MLLKDLFPLLNKYIILFFLWFEHSENSFRWLVYKESVIIVCISQLLG